MAKSLAELDREFRIRRQDAPANQVAASGGPEELDQAFRAPLTGQTSDEPKYPTPEALLPPLSENERRTLRRKRAVSLIADVLFYSAMLALILGAWVFARGGETLGGNIRIFHVLTTSMQSVYPKGSLVLVERVDPASLVVGNDITYYIDANTTVTHRIISIMEDYPGGGRAFATQGVDNPSPDYGLVPESAVVGKVVFFLPQVGALLAIFRERLWMIVLFFLSVVSFSFFLNLTLGETRQERKESKARKVLERGELERKNQALIARAKDT